MENKDKLLKDYIIITCGKEISFDKIPEWVKRDISNSLQFRFYVLGHYLDDCIKQFWKSVVGKFIKRFCLIILEGKK